MIIGISGGLGNQMFKYAFGISAEKSALEPVFFHKRYGPEFDMRHGRKFELDAFRVTGKFIDSPEEVPKIYRSYFDDGWQSEKYFDKDLVKSEFVLKNELSDKAKKLLVHTWAGPTTFIHVRRGDFLWESESFQGVLPLSYYKNAMAYIRQRNDGMRFFVFSDDPEWCRGTFLGEEVIGTGNAAEDMLLMSLCSCAIIANSTFSWWAAWLGDQRVRGPKRTVIAPRKWYADPNMSAADLVPERWVRL